MSQGYPRELQRSSLDIPLAAGVGDDEYIATLEDTLPRLIQDQQPDLIMYNAGG
jgi:acetoin utilization deacetylase AcuC-like enzyme